MTMNKANSITPEQQRPFELLLRVRYAECDAQAIVFNARYAEYADLAATEFMREVIGDYRNLVNQGVDNQVVSLQIDWKSSARFDDILALAVSINKVGNTSFTMNIDFTNAQTKREVASARIVYVMIDTSTMTKTRVTDELKDKLLTGAVGKVCNMSGA